MAKRTATTELNHDNWDTEEVPEKAGTFQAATDNVLKNREIKKARRIAASCSDGGRTKSIFSGFVGFSGFGGTKPADASTFGFLNSASAKPVTTNGTAGSSKTSFSDQTSQPSQEKSGDSLGSTITYKRDSEYYRHLKSLNESVTNWIKQHVDSNPYCLLTPVFKDYEKHIIEMEKKFPYDGQKTTVDTKSSSLDAVNNYGDFSFKKESEFSLGQKVEKTSEGNVFKNSGKDMESIKHFFKPSFSSVTKEDSKAFASKSTFDSKHAIETPFSFGLKTGSDSEDKASVTFGIAGKQASSDASTTGFSFGSGKPFTFVNVTSEAKDEKQSESKSEDESDEPPKKEFTKVPEDDAVYSKKCKLFFKKDGNFVEKGLGMLYLKPAGEKIQLLIRADTNLGNILLNLILNSSIPVQRVGKNNVMIACIPNPPIDPKAPENNTPTPMLIKVKTGDDANELLEKLIEYKK